MENEKMEHAFLWQTNEKRGGVGQGWWPWHRAQFGGDPLSPHLLRLLAMGQVYKTYAQN